MSSDGEGKDESKRLQLLEQLAKAGRDLSDTAVMFHTALGSRLNLGPSDWKTLSLLEQYGPMTAGELSERSGLAPPSVTGILDRLGPSGWIHRSRDPNDARRVIVSLDRAVVAENMKSRFEGLIHRLGELYKRYDDEELEMLLGFITEIARRQREATAELEAME